MNIPYAEVIGDPISQSKSPLIHKSWLAELGLGGDYRAVRVPGDELALYLESRRRDTNWRGCNVTIPHKEAVLRLLGRIDPAALEVGAVNCILPTESGLTGFNTDVDGVAAALARAEVSDRKAVIIGAGGGARAALAYLRSRQPSSIVLLVRNPTKANALTGGRVSASSFEACDSALDGAAVIVNASPLGMAGKPEMPPLLLDAVARHAAGATLLDMVYAPLETRFLATGRVQGARAVDGLTMLIGQAATAFERFFGRPPPPDHEKVRALLTS